MWFVTHLPTVFVHHSSRHTSWQQVHNFTSLTDVHWSMFISERQRWVAKAQQYIRAFAAAGHHWLYWTVYRHMLKIRGHIIHYVPAITRHFCFDSWQWHGGAVWTVLTVASINNLTYLPTYLQYNTLQLHSSVNYTGYAFRRGSSFGWVIWRIAASTALRHSTLLRHYRGLPMSVDADRSVYTSLNSRWPRLPGGGCTSMEHSTSVFQSL